MNECFDQVHRLGIDIIFNNDYQTPQDSMVDREQISEAIMIAKHTIIKIKYREGNAAPPVRLANMMLILDKTRDESHKSFQVSAGLNFADFQSVDNL